MCTFPSQKSAQNVLTKVKQVCDKVLFRQGKDLRGTTTAQCHLEVLPLVSQGRDKKKKKLHLDKRFLTQNKGRGISLKRP